MEKEFRSAENVLEEWFQTEKSMAKHSTIKQKEGDKRSPWNPLKIINEAIEKALREARE